MYRPSVSDVFTPPFVNLRLVFATGLQHDAKTEMKCPKGHLYKVLSENGRNIFEYRHSPDQEKMFVGCECTRGSGNQNIGSSGIGIVGTSREDGNLSKLLRKMDGTLNGESISHSWMRIQRSERYFSQFGNHILPQMF